MMTAIVLSRSALFLAACCSESALEETGALSQRNRHHEPAGR
jgi:hypothetical protein